MTKVVLFNKPFGVHSQFRKENAQMRTLADYFDDKTLRVAGRLDKDSEGLLILTDDGALNHFITTPPKHSQATKMAKSYLVQVENLPNAQQLDALRAGVMLKDGKTLPAQVQLLSEDTLPISLWARAVPIRERKNIPTAWLSIRIVEGRNRQVRRMVASVGLPCLRLIRYQIGDWQLASLAVGESRAITLDRRALSQLGLNISQENKPRKSYQSHSHANSNAKSQKIKLQRTKPNAKIARKSINTKNQLGKKPS